VSAWEAPGHGEWGESVAAYALRALPEAEATAFERHLADCAACRSELEGLASAVAALPGSVPPRAAPPGLRERVMADVRREAELLRAAGPEADTWRGERRRRRAPRWAIPALAAAAAALAFVIGVAVGGGGPGSRTVPVAATGPARGTEARILVEDGHVSLTARRLPPPPRGRVYMVWLKPHGGAPRPTSALFVPRADGTAQVAVPAAAAKMELVLVDTEPPGGSPAPTTTPVLTARMSS
jgi:hypothetical protein